MLITILLLLGVAALAFLLKSVFAFVNICFVRSGLQLKKQFGDWAIVTGATDGIGKAIAKQLLKQGLKVVLISRSADKLEETKKELTEACASSEMETLTVDFSDFNDAKRQEVKKMIEGKAIGVLVNNVGLSYDYSTYWLELDEKRVGDLNKVNLDSTVWMTWLVLPGMVERKKGCIVNTASISALNTCPLLAQYAACKEYILRFTQSLAAEYASKGVKFQCQVPGFVTSKMSKIRNPSLTVPTADTYAKAAVKCFGQAETVVSPFWAHYVMCGILRYLPEGVANAYISNMHHAIRKKALKKAEAKKE